MNIILDWKTGIPSVTGWYLCAYPNGDMTVQFVTKKDIDIVNSSHPEWLGPQDTLWYGPIEKPVFRNNK